jgi:hypothetical protein
VATVDVSGCPRSRLSDRSPDRSQLRPLGIPLPQPNGQLAGGEAEARRGGGGPPGEAALGEAVGTEPEALPIVGQELEGRAGAVAKDVDRAAQRVFPQRLATHRSKTSEAFAAIDRLQGKKEAALRGELEQQCLAKKVCRRGATAGEDSL